MSKKMRHCVFSATNCDENRREIEVAKETAEYIRFEVLGEYEGNEIMVSENNDKIEIYIISDSLFTLIETCMDFAREESCRRMYEGIN